jgi:molecular chaperone IbpA
MTSWNTDPFWRTSVGFDRLFDLLDESLRFEPQDNFPPCNISRLGEDRYRISMALAGYKPEQIDVTVAQNTLTVSGGPAGQVQNDQDFIYQGIGTRPFERQFSLADYVEVTAANLENGLLTIELERRLPDAMKPRRIELKTGSIAGSGPKALSDKAA